MGRRVPRASPPAAAEPGSASAGATTRRLLGAALFFALATLVLAYPLSWRPASLSRLDNGDARLNAWAISWVAHQAVEDPLALFDANTFHPLPYTLAYSEHLTLLGLAAIPLLALTDDLTLTNNLLVLVAIWLSALGMYLLVYSLTQSHGAALLAGLFFSFAPFRFNRLPHIQMQLYAFAPLVLWSLHRFLRERRRLDLFALGSFFVLQALAGTYLAAITAVALALALVTLLPFERPSGADLARLFAALVAAAAVLVPFTLPYLWVNRELGIEWDLNGLASLSATPVSYLASSSHLYRGLTAHLLEGFEVTDYLFPGLTLLALGAAGGLILLRDPARRPLLLCYGAILAVGVVLSLGPRTPVQPFLYEHVIFFRGLRALTRFGLLPVLSLTVFSSFALARLLRRPGGLEHPKLAFWGIALFFAAESTGIPYTLTEHRDEPAEVYRWLADANAKPGPIVELPFKVIDTRYMFFARHHGFRKTLNGDSGFVPMSHQWIKNALNRFPSDDSISLLRALEVRYVILHLGAFRKGALLRLLSSLSEYRGALLPVRDFGREVVFELVPAVSDGPRTASPELEALTKTRIPDASPASGMGPIELDLTLPEGLEPEAIRLRYGPAPRVPVSRLEAFDTGRDDGEPTFATPSDWPALTRLVQGLLETPRAGTQTIPLVPETELGQQVRLRLYGLDGESPDVVEVELLGVRR